MLNTIAQLFTFWEHMEGGESISPEFLKRQESDGVTLSPFIFGLCYISDSGTKGHVFKEFSSAPTVEGQNFKRIPLAHERERVKLQKSLVPNVVYYVFLFILWARARGVSNNLLFI